MGRQIAMTYRKLMLYEYEKFAQTKGVPKEFILNNWKGGLIESLKNCAKLKKDGGGCSTKKTLDKINETVKSLENPPYKLIDNSDWIIYNERHLLGVALTCHSTDYSEGSFQADSNCKDFINGKTGLMNLLVEIKSCKEHEIKKGDSKGKKMAFLSIEDSSCLLSDVCVFAQEYEKFAPLLYEGAVVLIQGERDKKKSSLIVKKVLEV